MGLTIIFLITLAIVLFILIATLVDIFTSRNK